MRKYAIGIDIGGTRSKVGLVDLRSGVVLDMMLAPTEKNDPELFLENLYAQYILLTEKTGIAQENIAGVGIGAPGFVYRDGSVDSTFGFLPFMDARYQLMAELENKFRLPCLVENDARIVALGETLFGKGRGYERVLVLTLGTGLGIGFTVNGKLERGLPYGHLGGHITIAGSDVGCYCGRKGCMEALVSATGISAAASAAGWMIEHPDMQPEAENVFRAAAEGSLLAGRVISVFLEHLRTGISNYIALFAPDMIIIGGGVSKGLTPYLDKLHKLEYLNPFTDYKFELALSDLDEHAGILGGAALFLQ